MLVQVLCGPNQHNRQEFALMAFLLLSSKTKKTRSKGCLLLFDLTDRATFANTNVWLAKIGKNKPVRVAKVLVGNKCDLTSQREVSREEAEQLAASNGMKYFETTATDHESTCGPFQCALQELWETRPGMTALHRAASAGDVAVVEQLCVESPEQTDARDSNGCSAFHYAAKNGHVDVIEALVRLGSKAIDTPDINDWTPLKTAAYFQHSAVIEDTPASDGRTPMHAAAASSGDQHAVIEALVRLGSRALDTPDHEGKTPMHAGASAWRNCGAIETLVRLGSTSIDALDHEGKAPMHCTITYSKHAVHAIEALVLWGSRAIDLPDKNGSTPLKLAIEKSNRHALESLLRMGSRALDHLGGFLDDVGGVFVPKRFRRCWQRSECRNSSTTTTGGNKPC